MYVIVGSPVPLTGSMYMRSVVRESRWPITSASTVELIPRSIIIDAKVVARAMSRYSQPNRSDHPETASAAWRARSDDPADRCHRLGGAALRGR